MGGAGVKSVGAGPLYADSVLRRPGPDRAGARVYAHATIAPGSAIDSDKGLLAMRWIPAGRVP
jgi:hypothetical protein